MLLLAMPSSATASGSHECQGNDNCDDVSIDIENGGASADSNSESSSSADSASESGAAASSDNSLAVTFTRPSSTTVRNVASPDTPNVYPSAPCRIARSAGLSLAGGAISGGASVEDVECTLRETARAFQYLGVPEIGLHLLCTQSHVVTGRRDKRGDLEEGSPPPLGPQECLRLVREFQGDVDDSNANAALQTEIEILREQQNNLERRFAAKADELEREHDEQLQIQASRPVPAPVVRQETIQQPMFDAEQRSYIQSLKIEVAEETEQ